MKNDFNLYLKLLSHFFLNNGRLDLLKALKSTVRVKKEDPWRNKKLKQKDFARKEDWEIFAENRDRKHVSFSKTN